MSPNLLLFLSLLLSLTQSQSATSPLPTTLSVTDFSPTDGDLTYDIAVIQSAINSCPTSGCHVIFPSHGTYLTAAICFKSGVILDVRCSATILAGFRREDYLAGGQDEWYAMAAVNASGVGINGGGTIDGQGDPS